MPATIKALETRYAGCRFRSRLETRWAVFYDTIGQPWRYEPEGFDLGDRIYYLPDFYLPNQDCYIEIKGQTPMDQETEKASRLCVGTGKRVLIFWGDIALVEPVGCNSAEVFWPSSDWPEHVAGDYGYVWCQCRCGKRLGIEFDGSSARLGCDCNKGENKDYRHDSPALVAAYEAARSARFRT